MRFRFPFLALLPIVGGLFAQPANLTSEAQSFIESHFRAARTAESAQQYDKASQEYEVILKQYPLVVPGVYQNLGLIYYFRKDYDRAIRTFEDGLKVDPEMTGAHLFLGASYLLTEQAERALPHLEFAHMRQPTVESATYLGQAYSAHLEYAKAAGYFQTALRGAEQKDNLLYLIGKSYLKLAERIVNDQTRLDPESKHTQLVAGKIFDSQNGYQVAAIKYLEAARLDPMNASIFLPLSRLLAILGLESASQLSLERYRILMPSDREAAIDSSLLPKEQVAQIGAKVDFEGILRSLPPVNEEQAPLLPMLSADVNEVLRLELGADKSGLWKAAVSHLSQGRVSEGILELAKIKNGGNWLRDYLEATAQTWVDNYERAEEIASHPAFANQKSPVVQLLRADIYQHLSLTYFNRLITEYPDSCRAHFVKAQNLAGQDKQEAEAEFRAAIAADPFQTQIRVALADHYLSSSKYKQALEECLRELELDPYSSMAKMRIGRIYIHLRDPKKGMAYLEEGLKSDPDDANARTDLARGYELLGQWDKAVEEYQRALRVDGSLNRVHYILGRIYRQLGKADLAQREYRLFQENEAREEKQHVNRIQRLRENAAGKELP